MKQRLSLRTRSMPAGLLVVALIAVLIVAVGCGAKAADDTGTTGTAAAGPNATTLIRDFFAGPGAEFVKDLTITTLEAKGDPGAIDLTFTISSDGSESQLWTLNGLIFGAMRGDRWPTALQDATGLVLAALHAEVDYPTGEPDIVDVDCAGGALSTHGPAPRYHMGGPDTTAAP
jgi:hypothetical protein